MVVLVCIQICDFAKFVTMSPHKPIASPIRLPSLRSLENTFVGKTCPFRKCRSIFLFFTNFTSPILLNFPNASSFGANTVRFPALLSKSVAPAALIAWTKVDRSEFAGNKSELIRRSAIVGLKLKTIRYLINLKWFLYIRIFL